MFLCYLVNYLSILFKSIELSKRLHFEMLLSVFNAPINLYFDVTPTGRVLNRFSKDMDQVDNYVFFTFVSC